MTEKNNQKRKVAIALAIAIVIVIVFFNVFFVKEAHAATTGSLGNFNMPESGYVTSLWAQVDMPFGGTFTIALKQGGTTIASDSSSEYYGWVEVPVTPVFVYKDTSYTIEVTLYPVAGGDCYDAYLTYTPYFLITVVSGYGNPTESAYVQQGQNYEVSVTSPDTIATGVRAYCSGYSIDGGGSVSGTTYTFTNVQATHTITFNWNILYRVTFSASGLDSTAQGTIVVAGEGGGATYSTLPLNVWMLSGSSISFVYTDPVSSSTSGKRFALYSSVSSPVTITGPASITATYVTQYYLTVTSSRGTPLGSGWYTAGSTAYAAVTPTLIYSGDYTRYSFSSWTGSGSGSYTGSSSTATVTMNAPITQTASWQTQYYLTVVGVYATATGSGWYNSGATANFDVSSPVDVGGGQYITFTSWTGSGSGSYTGTTKAASCTMNAPITETASWSNQYLLTIVSSYGTTIGGGWYDSGATAYARLTSGTVSGATGVRYIFNGWSSGGTNYAQSNPIVMTSSITVTASWQTQYYLTVTSAYSTPSGANWYNSGITAYASISNSSVTDETGTHTFTGWTGSASGIGLTSNAITMNSPKTAIASWSTTAPSSEPTDYTLTLHGPYYEYGTPAAGQTVSCTLLYANQTAYQFSMNSSEGTPMNLTITSTTALVQLSWNASSTQNYTRIYSFITGEHTYDVRIHICDGTRPSYEYTFNIADFYGMINPYLQVTVSDGVNNYVMEQANLDEGGGYVTFVLTQHQVYTLTFVCSQGSYSQTFTAATIGLPGQYPVSLNVLAGNFPSSDAATVTLASAQRVNGTTIQITFYDPSGNTSWVSIIISHFNGDTEIIDYTSNSTGSSQTFLWDLADEKVNYVVTVETDEGYIWALPVAQEANSNPWAGVFDFLGQNALTLPQMYFGFPNGLTSAQLAQMIACGFIMLFLGIGSFKNTGVSCIMAWILGGLMLVLGWFQGGATWATSIPMFGLAGFLSILIAIEEGKSTVREI